MRLPRRLGDGGAALGPANCHRKRALLRPNRMEPDVATPQFAAPFRGNLLQRHGLKLALSVFLGVGLAWVLSRGGLPLVPPASSFAALRLWTVVVYVLLLVVIQYLRAIRWRHLLAPLGSVSKRTVLTVSSIAFGAILLSPFRSGEAVRPYLLAKRSKIAVWEAAGTVGAERVIDGLMLSLLLFAGLQMAVAQAPLPDHIGALPVPAAAVPKAAYGALVLFCSAFVLMGGFFFAREAARRVTRGVIGVVSRGLADRVSGIVERVADGLRFLPEPRHLVPFLAETAAYWAVNIGGAHLLAWGSGLTGITLAQSAVTMGCIGVGVLVPSGPGFFGAFQLAAYMALAMYFPEATLIGPGAAFVFLLYTTQAGLQILSTVTALAADRAEDHAPVGMTPNR